MFTFWRTFNSLKKQLMLDKMFLLLLAIVCRMEVGAEETSFYTSVCEGQIMDLVCPSDNAVILVENANFGRTDKDTCAGNGPSEDTNCMQPGAYDIVSQICSNRNVCAIPVNIQVFGDPCPGVAKFLEVNLICSPPLMSSPPVPTTTQPVTTTGKKSSTAQSTATAATIISRMVTSRTPTTARIKTETSAASTTVAQKTAARVTPSELPSNRCPSTRRRDILWPATPIGVIAKQPCPEGSTGLASWICKGLPAYWDDQGPNLSNCQSVWVTEITVSTEVSAVIVSQEIVTNLAEEDNLYGSDIQSISTVMIGSIENFERDLKGMEKSERLGQAQKVTENYLQITSTMIDENNTDSWQDLSVDSQSSTASGLIISVEESAFLMADNYDIEGAAEEVVIAHEEENVLLEVVVQDLRHGSPVDAVFPQHLIPKTKNWKTFEDRIVIPKGNFEQKIDNDVYKVVFVAYNNLGELLGTKSAVPSEINSTEPVTKIVNSRILSASLDNPMKSTKLKYPVSITFQHLMTENITEPRCSYWKFQDKTHGGWATDGCEVINSNNTHTACKCDHLTNFAIIMDVHGVKIPLHHKFLLSWITYIGFIISCLCLFLAFITFCMFKNLQNDRTTIHKNLCACLFIAEVVFMAGISQTSQVVMCGVIAMMLHYFFLAAFAWMCLEGIQLYVMLVEVFEAEHSRRKYYYPFGYGVPLIIVGITALIDYEKYGTPDYCWLSIDKGFIWAFVAPICLIILVNSVFLSMALYIMCRHSKLQTNPKEKSTKEKLAMGSSRMDYASSWLRGALVLLCLLGVTWIVGLLYVSDNLVIFAYIFTICNASQGMFIFLFHCCMNDKVMKEYRRYIRNSNWLPDCVRNGYIGRLSSNSNQQQSFRSSSSKGRNSSSQDSKRLSNTTGSYHFDGKRFSNSSGCRFSGEYMPIQCSVTPIDGPSDGPIRLPSGLDDTFDYGGQPNLQNLKRYSNGKGDIEASDIPESSIHDTSVYSIHDEGIGMEIESLQWGGSKEKFQVDNTGGDFARFSKTDLTIPSNPAERESLMRESGIGADSQPASPCSESLPTISFHISQNPPEESTDIPKYRESGIGALHSDSSRSSRSSDQMCPGSPTTPDIPHQAYIFPNNTNCIYPNHYSMPDLVNPISIHAYRARMDLVPSSKGRDSKTMSDMSIRYHKRLNSDSDAYGQWPRHTECDPEPELYMTHMSTKKETLI